MTTTPTETECWQDSDLLEALCILLGGAVVGLPEEDSGRPISEHGIGANCAEGFRNEVFAIRDYCWCDGRFHPEPADADVVDYVSGGEGAGCPPNFEHFASGIKGVWYKHLGRNMRFSQDLTHQEALRILRECLDSLGRAS